jgi:hypothetical protein
VNKKKILLLGTLLCLPTLTHPSVSPSFQKQLSALQTTLSTALQNENKVNFLRALLKLNSQMTLALGNDAEEEAVGKAINQALLDFPNLFEESLPVEKDPLSIKTENGNVNFPILDKKVINSLITKYLSSSYSVPNIIAPPPSPKPSDALQPTISGIPTKSTTSGSTNNEECDWYCQLLKEASSSPITSTTPPSNPTTVDLTTNLTTSQLTAQLVQLSSADLSTVLQNVGSQLSLTKPTGNNKTSSFLNGLYTALEGLNTLFSQIAKSTDLSTVSNLKPYLRSRLLQIAGSL